MNNITVYLAKFSNHYINYFVADVFKTREEAEAFIIEEVVMYFMDAEDIIEEKGLCPEVNKLLSEKYDSTHYSIEEKEFDNV